MWGTCRRRSNVVVSDGDERPIVEQSDEHEHKNRELPRTHGFRSERPTPIGLHEIMKGEWRSTWKKKGQPSHFSYSGHVASLPSRHLLTLEQMGSVILQLQSQKSIRQPSSW